MTNYDVTERRQGGDRAGSAVQELRGLPDHRPVQPVPRHEVLRHAPRPRQPVQVLRPRLAILLQVRSFSRVKKQQGTIILTSVQLMKNKK